MPSVVAGRCSSQEIICICRPNLGWLVQCPRTRKFEPGWGEDMAPTTVAKSSLPSILIRNTV